MSLTLEELGIDHLSMPERLELISTLWDSIPNTLESLPIPEWHRQELERRLADCEAHPEANIPWEEVKARLRSRP
jgi:putative addiction module component (TIGR02574 family)